MWQLFRDLHFATHRVFTTLAAGCNTDDYATVAPPAASLKTYNDSVANSCTDTYITGDVVAKADVRYPALMFYLLGPAAPPV